MNLSNKTEKEKLLHALSWVDQALETVRPRHGALARLGGFLKDAAIRQGISDEDVKGTCGSLCDTIWILMKRHAGEDDQMWSMVSSMFNLPDDKALDGLRSEYAHCILYSLLITDHVLNLTGAGYVISEPVETEGEG